MKIRELQMRDAPRMLEWMQDKEVVKWLQTDKFNQMTITNCEKFICDSFDGKFNCHRAIVDENNQYVGTVSLKGIDYEFKDAEFAIVLRTDSKGHGYASMAMKLIMEIAFEDYHLDEVYWNVLSDNFAAICLYEKEGYREIKTISDRRLKRAPKIMGGAKLIWYSIKRKEYQSMKNS